jgi:hypothetical protein
MANCTICKKTIKLTPSASERAAKSGGKASDYSKLFTTHSQCAINKRDEDTRALIAKNTAHTNAQRVIQPAPVSAQ